MRATLLALLLALNPLVPAASWEFEAPIDVTGEARKGVFHQLESAGRKSIAVFKQTVALAWTDNRSGIPQVYVAFKALGAQGFGEGVLVSSGRAAYDPTVIALADGRFLLGWEEAGAVWARCVAPGKIAPPVRLSDGSARQIALAPAGAGAVAVWSQEAERAAHIVVSRLEVQADSIRMEEARPVEPHPPGQDQLYPSLVVSKQGITVAWEDRRHGHTRILYAHAPDGRAFSAPRELNELPSTRGVRYGRGSGVTRVALAGEGDAVAATWMDKRDYQTGYDIYAAFSRDGGRAFGANQKVQDQFGAETPQWHPAVAIQRNAGTVVAWDEERDGTLDIWLSWTVEEGWSEDLSVPGASGAGSQDNPVLALDEAGNLHLAWIDRAEPGAPTRVRYVMGRYSEE